MLESFLNLHADCIQQDEEVIATFRRIVDEQLDRTLCNGCGQLVPRKDMCNQQWQSDENFFSPLRVAVRDDQGNVEKIIPPRFAHYETDDPLGT